MQKVGQLTYEVTRQDVETLVGVDEGLISETLIDLYSKQGIVAEPAGAASVASLEILREYIKGKTICCIISGGNNDINRMPEMEEQGFDLRWSETLLYRKLPTTSRGPSRVCK